MKKVHGYFMLTAGAFFLGTLLLGAADAVAAGTVGTDANDVTDYYISVGGKDYNYESVSVEYRAASQDNSDN